MYVCAICSRLKTWDSMYVYSSVIMCGRYCIETPLYRVKANAKRAPSLVIAVPYTHPTSFFSVFVRCAPAVAGVVIIVSGYLASLVYIYICVVCIVRLGFSSKLFFNFEADSINNNQSRSMLLLPIVVSLHSTFATSNLLFKLDIIYVALVSRSPASPLSRTILWPLCTPSTGPRA